jgi:long-chain fatty acid transport protein
MPNYHFGIPLLAALVAGPVAAGSPALSGLVAEADNAESAFSNPAGMSRLRGDHVTAQGMLARSFSEFDVDESKTAVDGGDPDGGEDPIIIPSIYYVKQLNDAWHAGVSLTVPSGFGSNYGNTWAGRYETVDFSLVYIALSPAVAYRWNDQLSFGAALGINYTAENSEVKIPQPLSETDGKIKSDLDGVGVSLTLSMLYEFNERTRAGLVWTSDSEADLEGKVKLRKLGPVLDELATRKNLKNIDTEITNTLPQRVLAGIYHEFESGRYVTLDGLWMKFSDFTVSDIKLNGEDVTVDVPEIYNDMWGVTVGAGFPAGERMTYKVGAMYVSEAVDDDDRSFSIRLDRMWGVGAGLSYQLTDDRVVDLNATLINVGDASVDTANTGSDRGRVSGENDDPWTVLLELTYHF